MQGVCAFSESGIELEGSSGVVMDHQYYQSLENYAPCQHKTTTRALKFWVLTHASTLFSFWENCKICKAGITMYIQHTVAIFFLFPLYLFLLFIIVFMLLFVILLFFYSITDCFNSLLLFDSETALKEHIKWLGVIVRGLKQHFVRGPCQCIHKKTQIT